MHTAEGVLVDGDRVLIVLPSWIGDAVMATPVYRALRLHLPNAKLIGIMRPGLDEIVEGAPWFDEVVIEPPARFSIWRQVRTMRRANPRAAVLLPNSFRSALAVWLARVPVRLGYARDGRSALLTHRLEVERAATPQSIVPYYAAIARAALGTDSVDERLELSCSEAQRQAAERILPSQEIGPRLVILNPGANRSDKRWPAEQFARVGDALAQSHDATIAVTGSPAEADVVATVCAASRSKCVVNLVDLGIRIGSLKAIIERADLLVTNDTGPRHIALALGTNVVSLFGPTDHRWTRIEHAPGREHPILANPFLPDEMVADRFPRECAIERIATSDVINAAGRMLRSLEVHPPRARADHSRSPQLGI